MNANDRKASRTKLHCCSGCRLPLLGFDTVPFTDQDGRVFHARACYVRSTPTHVLDDHELVLAIRENADALAQARALVTQLEVKQVDLARQLIAVRDAEESEVERS